MSPPRKASARGLELLLFVLAGACLFCPPARGDDRDLLRRDGAKPYVFVLLDSSASMTLDPRGNRLPASGDDARSRWILAQEALQQALQEVEGVHFGFATLNQDQLRVRSKHWLYRVESEEPPLPIAYPQPGALLTFGEPLEGSNVAGSCRTPLPLSQNREAADRFPKLGAAGDQTTTLWLRVDSRTYRLTVSPGPGRPTPGSTPLLTRWALESVVSCEPLQLLPAVSTLVPLARVAEFLLDDGTERTAADAADASSDTSCSPGSGWEGNYDSGGRSGDPVLDLRLTEADLFCARPNRRACTHLLQPTRWSPTERNLDEGDMVPLRWDQDQRETLLSRLTPRSVAGGQPELRAAPLLSEAADPFTQHLTLVHPDRRPLIPAGRSPIGRALLDFACWYDAPADLPCASFAPRSWSERAAELDSEWACHRTYLVILTDGGNDCSDADPCAALATLDARSGVRSRWLELTGTAAPSLACGAAGRHLETIQAANGAELRAALHRVLSEIGDEAQGELSATLPPSQANASDVSYFASFVPVPRTAYWQGHLEAFRRPVRRDAAGNPERGSADLLWDAGVALLRQAPSRAEMEGGHLRLGERATERRVFYSRLERGDGSVTGPGSWPLSRRLLLPLGDPTVERDLRAGLGLPSGDEDTSLTPADAGRDRLELILGETLVRKETSLDPQAGSSYVLGDIFHSRPVVVGPPASPELRLTDLESDGSSCGEGNPGYRCFARKHRFRRRMVVAGANDGMLHIFDGGLAQAGEGSENPGGAYGPGKGGELAAYVPRSQLPALRERAEGRSHRYGVDGGIAAADVFIDPRFSFLPDPSEREFRTVLVAGFREGGRGYFALDVTQPDRLGGDGLARPIHGWVPSCLGSAPELEPASPAGCGPVPWPSPLWEFTDRRYDPASREWLPLDEDGDLRADLGQSWSPPSLGRVRLCEGGDCRRRDAQRDYWVAIFGGGPDPAGGGGQWIYMVDIETGQEIYKRRVTGAVAAGVTAIDVDLDGYLDRLYVATLVGLIYRVDLAASPSSGPPRLREQRVRTLPPTGARAGASVRVRRVPPRDEAGRPQWEPRVVFDSGAGSDPDPLQRADRAIYHRPVALLVASLGRVAIAFGTGDRSDLWSRQPELQRFHLFVDDTDEGDPPLTPADLMPVTPEGGGIESDLLTERPLGKRGWHLTLDAGERVIGSPLAFSGVTAFTTFRPSIEVSDGEAPRCTKSGDSRVFLVNTTNGDGLFPGPGGAGERYEMLAGFAGDLVKELVAPHADSDATPGGDAADDDGASAELLQRLRELQPADCRFTGHRIELRVAAPGSGKAIRIPMPICVRQKAWREF